MEINEKITIYYFSATGNSLKVAMDIASQYVESEMIQINDNEIVGHINSKIIGFVFPVYMGTLPNIVKSFLLNFQFQNEVYYFAVGTYYTYRGCTLSVVDKIIKDKGASLNYSNYVATVGNCLMEYEVPKKKRYSILKHAEETIKIVVNDIANLRERESSKYHHSLERLHNWLFNLLFKKAYKKFSLEDSCTNCGICMKVCPINNISNHNEKPQWGNQCIACHACVHWCPQNAINLGRSKGRLQYRNPHISVSILLKSKQFQLYDLSLCNCVK